MPLPLAALVDRLERLAPLHLAADWDNVGLLVEPVRANRVRRVALTIDLTEAVLDEALDASCQVIVAYHPPIFAPLRRLTAASAKERIIARALRHDLAIWSPHTALDAVAGGVNDWLADAFGKSDRRAIEPATVPTITSADTTEDPPPQGQGRDVVLTRGRSLEQIVRSIKRHLGLRHVRVAPAPRHAEGGDMITRVALCAGAGGSVVSQCDADLYWTGEMRHHDVLAANERGTSVVLCEHTNTERGYLPTFAEHVHAACDGRVQCVVATSDRDPLRVR